MATPPSIRPNSPATLLEGKELNGWIVGPRVAKKAGQTGGCFSVTYRVSHKTTKKAGFLKAVDLIDKAGDLKSLTNELNKFRYEEELLKLCQDLKMDGVVVTLDSGEYLYDLHGFQISVPFLIFEEAEGDLRSHPNAQDFNLTWRLRVFHGVCVAMNQLHKAEIAHQDLKPSNILVFAKRQAKVADLGRATRKANPSMFDGPGHQGDRNYQPVELLYGEFNDGDWLRRRLGADFFMMGCLLTYLITDSSLLTLLYEKIDTRFWPGNWKGTYREVLPHLESAFEATLVQIESVLPSKTAKEVSQIVACLAHPNYERRGRPYLWGDEWQRIKIESPDLFVKEQYSLEYIISRIDNLANESALGAKLNKHSFLDFLRSKR